MKLKYISTLLVSMLCFMGLKAQDEIVYDQYYWNYYLVNPAVAGASRCSHLLGSFNRKWVGVEDAPLTVDLSFRTRVLKNLGIGAYGYFDRNGNSLRQGGQVSLAYHIPLTQNSGFFMKDRDLQRQLSFGLSAVVSHYGFSSELFRNEDAQNDPTIDNGGKDKGVYFNANFGSYFLWDRFFAGLSIANMIPTEMEELGENEPVPPMTFFIFAGYTFPVNETIDIEPAAMFKFNENDERQLDFNLKYEQEVPDTKDVSYWLQLAYRQTLDEGNAKPLEFSPMGGINFKGFHLGYAYTLGLTKWARHNSGSHSAMLGYSWCKVKKFCR